MKANDFLKEFCIVFGADENELKSDSRKPELVADRKLFFHIGRRLNLSTIDLGAAINRDHSLVVAHTKKITRPEALLIEANIEHFKQKIAPKFHVNLETDGFNAEIIILTIDGIRFTTKADIGTVKELMNKLKSI